MIIVKTKYHTIFVAIDTLVRLIQTLLAKNQCELNVHNVAIIYLDILIDENDNKCIAQHWTISWCFALILIQVHSIGNNLGHPSMDWLHNGAKYPPSIQPMLRNVTSDACPGQWLTAWCHAEWEARQSRGRLLTVHPMNTLHMFTFSR